MTDRIFMPDYHNLYKLQPSIKSDKLVAASSVRKWQMEAPYLSRIKRAKSTFFLESDKPEHLLLAFAKTQHLLSRIFDKTKILSFENLTIKITFFRIENLKKQLSKIWQPRAPHYWDVTTVADSHRLPNYSLKNLTKLPDYPASVDSHHGHIYRFTRLLIGWRIWYSKNSWLSLQKVFNFSC